VTVRDSDDALPLPAGFMSDYVAECSEHLGTVRRALLSLESLIDRGTPDRRVVDDLFHAFHSLKGLSGMVALADAETLAHEMESFLRRLQQSPTVLSGASYSALVDAARRLEQIVGSAETGAERADIQSTVERLTAPEADGRATWRFEYAPSAALAERGVTVASVRAALEELGEILEATPSVGADGSIAFQFLVASTADEARLAPLAALGLRWQRPGPVRVESAAAATAATPAAVAAPSQFVRVDLARLDELMRLTGDLVVTRAGLAEAMAGLERHAPARPWRAAQDHTQALERQLRDLRAAVMRVRMVPIGDVFERMTFVARGLAREQGKRLALQLEGARTEVDKFVVERLSDPLLHMVRNAISHGLQTPAERVAAGKPEEATLRLRAATAGDAVRIDVEDDGRGIDAARVAERARAIGLPVPAELDGPALLDLLCAPGFSTRGTVDRASGRGVGMAVVRRVVGEMGGVIALETRAGHGTSFSIHLPLTLAITDALIATVADRTFAIPQGAVREVMEVAADSIRRMEGAEVVAYRGSALPLVRLSQRFQLRVEPRASHHVFVAGTAQAPVGIAVDRIVGQREIVVRTFSDQLVKVDGIVGATELGDGRVVLILDPAALTRTLPRSRA
jgi:two-component system chemotaxis sensor kinase CheA